MLKTIDILFAVTIPVLAVLAQVVPTEPAPGNVYNQGSECNIEWETDPTAVATVDGTKESSYSYTCPEVSPNSAIYFYQFSSPAAPGELTWTGRFAIADEDGNTTPPEEEADGVEFGTGKISAHSSSSSGGPEPSSSSS